MPMSASRRVTAAGTVDPPRPTVLKRVRCSGGAVGMVEQAGDEVRRPAADRQPVALDQPQHLARIPDVGKSIDAPSSTGIRNAPSMPMKCPTGVAVSWRPRSAG